MLNSLSVCLFRFLAEFSKNAVCRLRVDERDVQTFGAFARSFVDEAHAFAFHFSQSVGNTVFNGKCEVMDAFAALLDEFGDRALVRSRLEELKFGLSNLEERILYFMVGNFFDRVSLHSENVFIIRNGFVKALDSDSEMFDVRDIHNI